MARGFDKHQERLDEIARLGKDLARRAGRKCELCEGTDELRTHDTAPDDEPSFDTLLLLCARCRDLVGGAAQDPRTLRFLEGSVWSEVPIVASTARELLRGVDAEWARATLEMVEPAT